MRFRRPKDNGGAEQRPLVGSHPGAEPAVPDAGTSGVVTPGANDVAPPSSGAIGQPGVTAPLGVTTPRPMLPGATAPLGVTTPRPMLPGATAPLGIMRPARANPLQARLPGVAAPGGALGATRLSREVRRLLASLGSTPGDVAATLESAGVRATPRDASRSPVSLYLRAVIGADPNVKSVVVDHRSVAVELRAWWRPSVVVDLPSVVHEFTAAFDECCYPALLPPGHRAE